MSLSLQKLEMMEIFMEEGVKFTLWTHETEKRF